MKKIKVFLTVKCRNMRNPKLQRYKFDQTLGSASWMMQENKKPTIHDDGCVTTTSVWGRMFGGRKTEVEIQKLANNQIKRAAAFAEIDDYSSDLQFHTITKTEDEFQLAPVLTSDD
jgi:hypothetical protein